MQHHVTMHHYTHSASYQTKCHHLVFVHTGAQPPNMSPCSLYTHSDTTEVSIQTQTRLQSLYALRHNCSRYMYSGTIAVAICIQAQLQSLPYALFRHNCSSYIHSGETAVAKCTEAQFHWGTIAVDVLIQSGTIIRRLVPMQSPYTLRQSQNVSACIDYTPGRQTSCHGALFIPFQPNIAHMLQFKDAIVIRL